MVRGGDGGGECSVPEHETCWPGADDADIVALRFGLACGEQGHYVDWRIFIDGLGAWGGLVVVAVDEGVCVHVYIAVAAPGQRARRTVGHGRSHEARIEGPGTGVRGRWEDSFNAGPLLLIASL